MYYDKESFGHAKNEAGIPYMGGFRWKSGCAGCVQGATVDARVMMEHDVKCGHDFGVETEYYNYVLGRNGRLARVDTRKRKACMLCGHVEDWLVSMEHRGGLVL